MGCVKWLKCSNIFVNPSRIVGLRMGLRFGLLFTMLWGLSACVSNILTGANIIYDRHSLYIKLNDFQLGADANRALFNDNRFKCEHCSIEIAAFKGELLMVGHVPTQTLRREASERIQKIPQLGRFHNELALYDGTDDPVLDSWITAKIRSEILADATIEPNEFKIVTMDQVVYIMGSVMPSQAEKVLLFARECREVKRVVTLLRYYHLSN